jgi:RNA ligase
MSNLPPFEAFASIPRLRKTCCVTEKLDGTNGIIEVLEDGRVLAGSGSRWITPEDDNYGFARWVKDHEDELRTGLGIGKHFGEWWGAGIQRRYGLKEKRFSLFNVARWKGRLGLHGQLEGFANEKQGLPPACCGVVPVLWEGEFDTYSIRLQLNLLASDGSVAAPGFTNPEGVVVYHAASGQLFKQTLEGDGHKSAKKEV